MEEQDDTTFKGESKHSKKMDLANLYKYGMKCQAGWGLVIDLVNDD